MSLRSLTIVAALTLVATPASAARYTLAQLLERVHSRYSGVQAARAGVDGARAQLSQANRQWWPSGQLTFGLTGSPLVRCRPSLDNCQNTNAVDFATNTSLSDILPVHGAAFNLSVNLVQPLYTFGKIEGAQEVAQAGLDVAYAEVDKQRAEVTFNMTRAYWGLKWARAAHATLDDGIKKLSDWVKKINSDIEAGKTTYTESDLIRVKLALDTAQLFLLDIDKGGDAALAGLRTLADDPEADIDESELDVSEALEQPLSFYEDEARLHRPEARMLVSGQAAAAAQRKLKLGELLPDIGLLLGFTYAYAQSVDNPSNAFLNHPGLALGASLLLVIRYNLDVPQRLAGFDKARADEQVAMMKRVQALGGIAIEIANNYYEARSARRRADLLGHSEKIARGWYNAVDQNLQVGVADGRELVEAARAYFDARLRHLQAIMDVNVTTASLKQSAGVIVK